VTGAGLADLPQVAFEDLGFHVGSVRVETRVLMAPMMGYNEQALRRICRTFGSGLAVTEMVKPEKLLRGDPMVLRDLVFGDDERPLGVQVAVREPERLVPALQDLAGRGFDFVDLNMGCPLKKECNKGWGAALMRDAGRVGELVAAAVAAVDCPVTVKVRAGYELGELQAPAVVDEAVRAGAALICVHGRTKMGWYREPNSLEAIRSVVEAVGGRVPVVGNGDVVDLPSAVEMFAETDCDAIMIGRGAVGNPWIFRQVSHYLATGEALGPPDLPEVRALFEDHMDQVQAVYGERRGFSQVKRYAYYYFGRFGLDNSWRAKIAKTRRRVELQAVLDGVQAAAC
jgi:tRNA-dihydrouridine synthase B